MGDTAREVGLPESIDAGGIRPLRVRAEWKPQDLWIGAFWKVLRHPRAREVHVWVCVVPMLPIHVHIWRRDG